MLAMRSILSRPLKSVVLIGLVVCLQLSSVLAVDKDVGYSYDVFGRVVPAPNSYIVDYTISGDRLGIGAFKGATELFIERKSNQVYLLDAGNSRVVVLDSELKLVKTISFTNNSAPESISNSASGIFVTFEGVIYLADTGNDRLIISDGNGVISKILYKPENELIDPNVAYQPKKVLVDSGGIIYVISSNISGGALTIDQNGEFICFYGANRIQSTLKLLQEMFWRQILSESQATSSGAFVPVAYTNFDIDNKDFIYTVTSFSGEGGKTGQLKKLNPMGTNLFDEEDAYGEYSLDKTKLTSLIDVNVDEYGFITALDGNNGKLFQYDKETSLLSVFGGKGNTVGTFMQPVAIVNVSENILVLDSAKNYIAVFKPTYFGQKIREASIKYSTGLYAEALEPWREVANLDSNYQIAYSGIGSALEQEDKFVEAMENYKVAGWRIAYSDMKKQFRNEWVRENFSLLALGIVLLVLILYLATSGKLLKKIIGPLKNKFRSLGKGGIASDDDSLKL